MKKQASSPDLRIGPLLLSSLLLAAGCGGGKSITPTPITQPVYSYASLNSQQNASGNSLTYSIDHVKNVVEQSYASSSGVTVAGSGPFTAASNGFLAPVLNTYSVGGVAEQTAEVGNWAVEVPGAVGFFYQSAPNSPNADGTTSGPLGGGDTSQNVVPLVGNTACPSFATAQTFQFVTFPGGYYGGDGSGLGTGAGHWNPLVDAAYGSVSVATVGSVVNLSNIQQYLLPLGTTVPGTPVTTNPGPFSASGGCGASLLGDVASVVVPVAIDSVGDSVPVATAIGISSGFLLQDNNGASFNAFQVSNLLGAGYGAVGLAQPASPLTTSTLTQANYDGFLTESSSSSAFSTTAAFSGASAGSTACAAFQQSLSALATQPSANALYGGEFAGNDPSANTASQCDFAIDLGAQDAKNNGLFPNATLYVGGAFPLNQAATGRAGAPYSLPAVAIAGQAQGKNAIFVISLDAGGFALPPPGTVAIDSVGIYLLQQ